MQVLINKKLAMGNNTYYYLFLFTSHIMIEIIFIHNTNKDEIFYLYISNSMHCTVIPLLLYKFLN